MHGLKGDHGKAESAPLAAISVHGTLKRRRGYITPLFETSQLKLGLFAS